TTRSSTRVKAFWWRRDFMTISLKSLRVCEHMFVQEFCQGCNFSYSCTWMMPLRLKRGANECRSEKCAAKFLCATSARIKTNRRASFARRCGNGSIARWNYQGTFGSGFGGTKLSRHLNDH